MKCDQCEALADGIRHALSQINDIRERHPELPDEGFKELDSIRTHLLGTLIEWKGKVVDGIMGPTKYADPPEDGTVGWCAACNSRCFVLYGTCRGCAGKATRLHGEQPREGGEG